MNTSKLFITLLFALSLGLVACDDEDDNTPAVPQEYTLQAVGVATGTPVETTLEGIDLEVAGNAFVMDFFDKQTGERLGSVADINVAAETFEDGSMDAENFTVFTFEDDNSTLILHNFIEMTPVDSVTLHGTIPTAKAKYNVIGGTGRFAGAAGGSTLDATLDMTQFAQGTIGFDCTYDVTIEP